MKLRAVKYIQQLTYIFDIEVFQIQFWTFVVIFIVMINNDIFCKIFCFQSGTERVAQSMELIHIRYHLKKNPRSYNQNLETTP